MQQRDCAGHGGERQHEDEERPREQGAGDGEGLREPTAG